MGKFKIDKSKFTPEQLAQWDELLEIGKSDVDPAANKEEVEDDVPPAVPKKPAKKGEEEPVDTKKSEAPAVEVPDFVKAAIKKSEEFIEQQNKKEMTEIAKKYAVLGQKPEELGEQLYNLKKRDEAMYNTCISMLDGQVALIEKSGVFAEIGKSGHGGNPVGSGAEAKIDAAAQAIMKSDPNMTYEAAITKACTDDPSLMAEYDAEYFGY